MNIQNSPRDFEALLDYLKMSRGFDFTGYKRASLMRRIDKRRQEVGIEGYDNYQDYLEVHPEEFAELFNTILINVTGFFRDPSAWEYIRSEVIPRIIARKKENDPIRIWSAGCASGEEAYTIAMALAEALGIDQFRDRVKIYATDVDEDALNKARHATYTTKEVIGIPPLLLEKYFERGEGHCVFRKELRRSIIFGRHDLIQDAPISRTDLLICRNILMYFNTEAQARILARFHFALNDGAFLFLGRAEMLYTHTNTFKPVDLKCRVFTKIPRVNLRDHLMLMAQTGREEGMNSVVNHVRLRETAFDGGLTAQIVLDTNNLLTLLNARAQSVQPHEPGHGAAPARPGTLLSPGRPALLGGSGLCGAPRHQPQRDLLADQCRRSALDGLAGRSAHGYQ